MRGVHILAATDFSTRSSRALRQAGLLARDSGAQLDIVHVVDDDQPEQMVEMERREAEQTLAELMGAMPELREVRCRPMVVVGDPFGGILWAAAAIKAYLIVMGVHRRRLLREIFIGTTIERVVRGGSFPVLMVNSEAQRHYEKVVAPVDLSEPSADAIRVAVTTGLLTEARPTLLHVFSAVAKGKMFTAGANQASIDKYVATERQRAMDNLAAFLAANDLGSQKWSLRVEEGPAGKAISRAVEQMHPDLLIMGTHGRSGLFKLLLGSVTEEALRSLHVDILAVPPVR
jgi:universal stress protein E